MSRVRDFNELQADPEKLTALYRLAWPEYTPEQLAALAEWWQRS